MQKIDVENWYRKDHFRFFTQFDEPFYGLVAKIKCTKGYAKCKEKGWSFYLYYLHKAMSTSNEILEFRTRIIGGIPYLLDVINASPTVLRPDKTFGFSYQKFYPDFEEFEKFAKIEILRVEQNSGLEIGISGQDVIHCSAVPWIDFTSLSHARNFKFEDSCPKISFGKMTESNGSRSMPVSIHVHHALVDGYHVGLFFELFQQKMDGE